MIEYGIYKQSKYKYLICSTVIFKFLLCCAMIYIGFDYLNRNKFFTDAYSIYYNLINLEGYELIKFEKFNGFINMARIYKIILLGHDISFELFVMVCSIIYFLIYLFLIKTIKVKVNKKKFLIFCCVFVFDAIFLMQPSKEQLSLLINIFILRNFINNKKYNYFFIIVLLAIYGYFFRQYYFVILLVYIFIKMLISCNKLTRYLLIIVNLYIIYYLFYSTTYLDSIINLRFISESIGENTKTLINNVIPYGYGEKNLVNYVLNFMINFLRLIFPIEVLWKSLSRGLVFVPIQFYVDYIIYTYLKILCKNKDNLRKCKVILNIFIYILSFLLVQTLFEPDFGSVFRHNMNIMPFILYLYFSIDYKNLFKISDIKEKRFNFPKVSRKIIIKV